MSLVNISKKRDKYSILGTILHSFQTVTTIIRRTLFDGIVLCNLKLYERFVAIYIYICDKSRFDSMLSLLVPFWCLFPHFLYFHFSFSLTHCTHFSNSAFTFDLFLHNDSDIVSVNDWSSILSLFYFLFSFLLSHFCQTCKSVLIDVFLFR